jgi:hypothetical protein
MQQAIKVRCHILTHGVVFFLQQRKSFFYFGRDAHEGKYRKFKD